MGFSDLTTARALSPNCYATRLGTEIDLIVLHDMETPETNGIALSVARNWFGTVAAMSSAHYCIDNLAIVGCVDENATAWHTPKVNKRSIGIEQPGRASQTREGWLDPYSDAVLTLLARLLADLCHRHNIPLRLLSDDELRRGDSGITYHAQCTRVFGGTHTDPGTGYPFDEVMARAQGELDRITGGGAAAHTPTRPAPAPASDAFGRSLLWFDPTLPVVHGLAVKAVQSFLMRKYPKTHGATILAAGGADGFYGAKTAAAVKSYQAAMSASGTKIAADGVVGQGTWAVLIKDGCTAVTS